MGGQPAVFFDLYGTLAEEVGYVNHPLRLQLYPWTIPTLQKLQRANCYIIVVTNQAGIERGYFTQEVLDATMKRFIALLEVDGIKNVHVYTSTSSDETNFDRKPKPGMAYRAAKELGIDLATDRCYMVGDSIRDMQFAVNAHFIGCSYFVLTGYGRGYYEYNTTKLTSQSGNFLVVENCAQAVEKILGY